MKITVSDFTGSYSRVNGTLDIAVTPRSLFHAAITVGANSYASALGSSLSSLAFAFHKVMALMTVIEFSDGEMILPPEYGALDQSEKASLGYWIGMAMCKLAADKILEIPWLRHVSSLSDQISWMEAGSRSAPDLVGQDRSNMWHVMEAKARQRRPSSKNRKAWKMQAGRVASISGAPPVTNSYCLTLIQSPYSVELVDPPAENDQQALSLDISPHAFFRTYYQPFIEFFSQENEYLAERGRIVYRPAAYDPMTGLTYEIGIIREILDRFQRNQIDIPQIFETSDTDTEYVGSDGIAVRYGVEM